MLTLYRLVLGLHIVAGFAGLVAFWTPAVAKKGGVVHVRAGRIFFWATCVITITGLMMAALLVAAPLSVRPLRVEVTAERAAAIATRIRLTGPFLAYLLLITFAPVYHGVRVLETRRDPPRLRTPFHTFVHAAAIATSVAMVILGALSRQPVFVAMSPIGFLVGFGGLSFARKPYPTRMAWWYEHMGSMIGGGVAFHTAFLVLGAARLFNFQVTGSAAIVPWILPTLIGLPASAIWVRYYRRKFREDATGALVTAPAGPRNR